VQQDLTTPSSVKIDFSYDQPGDTPLNYQANVITFAATAWAGCNGPWPNGANYNPPASQASDYLYPARQAHVTGTSTLTIPARRSLCVGFVAYNAFGDIEYKAIYLSFDKPTAVNNGAPERSPNSLTFPLDVDPNGLPTSYYLAYFKRVQTDQCNFPSEADLLYVQTTPSETISDDLHSVHEVSPTISNLAPETSYCVAIRSGNSAGSYDESSFYWGYVTTSPPPTVANESYVGGNGFVNFAVDVTPMSLGVDAELHFQYFKKIGAVCTLDEDADTIYTYPAMSPNRGYDLVHVPGAIDNLDPHTDYCVRAYASNGAGESDRGDFSTVRSVLKLPITVSYSYLAREGNDGDVALHVGYVDNGAYEDSGVRSHFTADLFHAAPSSCNAATLSAEAPDFSAPAGDLEDDGTGEFTPIFDLGTRGTDNCIRAVATSGWGSQYGSIQYFPIKSGVKPAFDSPTISHTAHSITLSANLDPGEHETSYSVMYVKPENGESCGSLMPTSQSEGTIDEDLSELHEVSATVTGLDEASTYCALFISSNLMGQGYMNFYLQTTTDDVTAPSKPAGIEASAVTQTSATLSWPESTDNTAVADYRIYREGKLLATKTEPTTSVSTVCGETAHFIVTATDESGNESAPSDEFTLKAAACDVPPHQEPARRCFSKIKTQSAKLKSGKKSVKASVASTVAADGQSVKITAKAKGAKITFKVDGKKVSATKGSITIAGTVSVVAVSFKYGSKGKAIQLHPNTSVCA
jgi:hypothetical protein